MEHSIRTDKLSLSVFVLWSIVDCPETCHARMKRNTPATRLLMTVTVGVIMTPHPRPVIVSCCSSGARSPCPHLTLATNYEDDVAT